MKIKVICVGKTDKAYLQSGEQEYLKRLHHYVPTEKIEINDLKDTRKLSQDQIREKEGQLLLSKTEPGDLIYLLDEQGKSYRSVDFATFLQKQLNRGSKNLVFLIGGAYGFSRDVYDRAEGKISLSDMTFSHQMVRLFFLEQLYRGFSILKGEPYHHE